MGIKYIILPLIGMLLCAGCKTTKTGTWSFFHENGDSTHGTWTYEKGEALTAPWHDSPEFSSVTGHLVVKWSKNGSKFLETFFVDGKPHGIWILWHNNNELKCVGKVSNGVSTGVWLWWDKKGKLIEHESRNDTSPIL